MSIAFDHTPPNASPEGLSARTRAAPSRGRPNEHESLAPAEWNSWDGARPWPVRPAVGFLHPLEVLKDGDLDLQAKREILAAWASDASAVPHRPSQRWLLGTPAPVPLSEVLSALSRLDSLGFS